ncbi:MAG: hypothetical protein H6Q85_1227, partial [candidate division NC10 bacterium]|nr:hypothetical protein [candidate division NC10 bacterium]
MDLLAANSRPAHLDPTRWFKQRLAALALLVTIADFLFYQAPAGGLPLALFLVLLFVAAATFNRLRSSGNWRLVAAALLFAAIAALMADADPLSVPLAVALSTASVVLLVHGAVGWLAVTRMTVLLPLTGWLRLAGDFVRIRRATIRRGRLHFDISGWIVPVGLSLFFLVVFLVANPVLDHWAGMLSPDHLMLADGRHIIFWGAMALIVWPVLHLVRRRHAAAIPSLLPIANGAWSIVFGDGAVRRSLVAFNLLFALQTLTDLGYLWGGMDLPKGMTHAEYAHRGAYPLMAAAMMAAAFVLIALRNDQHERRPRALTPFLAVFVGQGLGLVISSMLRLDLYVEAYSLTLWRVAAFVWMGLVAFGFGTILIRILFGQSTPWLVNVNAGAVLLALWACCFVDFAGLVTGFNVAHSRQATGQGPDLDFNYIARTFGARAIPALDARRDLLAGRGTGLVIPIDGGWVNPSLDDWRDQTAAQML